MTRYQLVFTTSARKDVDALASDMTERIVPLIRDLIETPRPHGCTKLRGHEDLWRIRVSDYRIVYAIDDKKRLITIFAIGHRRDVYR